MEKLVASEKTDHSDYKDEKYDLSENCKEASDT